MPNKIDIQKLRKEQFEKGWTDEKLAAEAGVGPATIWRTMNLIHRPNLSTLKKICFALGLPIASVFIFPAEDGRHPDPTPPGGSPKPVLKVHHGRSGRGRGSAAGNIEHRKSKIENSLTRATA